LLIQKQSPKNQIPKYKYNEIPTNPTSTDAIVEHDNFSNAILNKLIDLNKLKNILNDMKKISCDHCRNAFKEK